MEKKDKPYLVFELYKAVYLIRKGFNPFAVRPDKYNPNKIVYLFNASKELEECVHNMSK